MRPPTGARCLNCNELFCPDCRNRDRQRFCAKPECRKASKAQSQRRWLEQPENRDYFRSPQNTVRVQQWRREHPDYWRHAKRNKKPDPSAPSPLQEACGAALQDALQDSSPRQSVEHQGIAPKQSSGPSPALQDSFLLQSAVFVGLISLLTGSALQEDIARSAQRFFVRGQDILGIPPAPSPSGSIRPVRTPSPMP